MTVFTVGLFGVAGVLCRYFVDSVTVRSSFAVPVGTFLVNITGSFLAGVLYVIFVERGLLSPRFGQGLTIGFCGGFTTFSAYSVQTFLLFERGSIGLAFLYFLGSPLFGLMGAFLGIIIARSYG